MSPRYGSRGGEFEATPNWAVDKLRSVEGTLLVLEEESRWRLDCTLILQTEEGGSEMSLCDTGVLDPDTCNWTEPTPPMGTAITLRFGPELVDGWTPGLYAVRCSAVDEAGHRPPDWHGSFHVDIDGPAPPPPVLIEHSDVPPESLNDTRDEPTTLAMIASRLEGGTARDPDRGPDHEPVCGDFVCTSGEGQDSCCADCGCPVGFTCRGDRCLARELACEGPGCGSGTPSKEDLSKHPNMVVVLLVAVLVAGPGSSALELQSPPPTSLPPEMLFPQDDLLSAYLPR